MEGDIRDVHHCEVAVRDVDALIHTAEPPPELPSEGLTRDQQLLDLATRGTHTLFRTAVDAGVRRFLYAGSLAIFDAYPEDVYITEMWKPQPSSNMRIMSRYLGELTAREFVRGHRITGTCLRLGELVLEEETTGKSLNRMWLDFRDAAQAFICALKRDASERVWWTDRWALYHVTSDLPDPRFLIDRARQLGYRPERNFRRT